MISIYYILLTIAAGCGLLVLGLLALTIYRTQMNTYRFKKNSNNIPMWNNSNLISGNILALLSEQFLPEKISALHKQLGKTFGLMHGATPTVFTIDLDLIKKVVIDDQSLDRISLNLPIKEAISDNIMLCPEKQWRHIRRAFAPAVRSQRFKSPNVVAEIQGSINKLVEALELRFRNEGKEVIEVNIDEMMHRYSLNLVFSCFYKQYNLVDFDSETDELTRMIDAGLNSLQFSSMVKLACSVPFTSPLIDWLIWNFHEQGHWRRTISNFIGKQTKLRLEARQILKQASEEGKKIDEDSLRLKDGTLFKRNMIDHVIDSYIDGKLTRSEYFNSTLFLLNAADKTASDALANLIYHLATHMDIQEKLRESVLAKGFEDCEYLSWAIFESLRLTPAAPVGCSRTSKRDYEIPGGYMVPKGTFVVTPAFTIHRLKEYWGEDVEEFRPERFKDMDKFHPLQFIPFGYGPRGCLGKDFAIYQMKMLIEELLKRYRFECEPQEIRYDSPYFIFLIPNSHVFVRMSRL